ncbi:MAG TPA: FAD binding domain-containing protein, partial [Gemmataceae bacterium]
MRDHLRFVLNGRPQTVRGSAAFGSLTDYLRGQLGLAGTKVVCAEGDCGACTVLVGRPAGDGLRYAPVDACIQFLYQLDGTQVVTVEGLSANGDLHPVQRAMVDCHGSQCGYCTPGIVMALAGWAEAGCRDDARLALTGNLCRCTGYLSILDAAAAIAAVPADSVSSRYDTPALVSEMRGWAAEPLHVTDGRRKFAAPTRLEDAVTFKAAYPGAVVVAGGTELGVLRNKRGDDPAAILTLARVPGLGAIERQDDRVAIGANATWAQIERDLVPVLPALGPIVSRFGSPQIRAVATLAGNVVHGSPIADSLPLLLVMDAELELVGPHGVRRRSVNGFCTGYKQKDMAADELLARVTLSLPAAGERLRLYKVSRRNDLDIATFGAAVRIHESGGRIESAAVAYSGVGPTVVRLPRTEAALTGRPFRESTFRHAGRVARSEAAPITDVRGGRDFRAQLAENILVKFYFEEVNEGRFAASGASA